MKRYTEAMLLLSIRTLRSGVSRVRPSMPPLAVYDLCHPYSMTDQDLEQVT